MSRQKKTLPKKISIFGKTITVIRADLKDGEFGEYMQHQYLIKISKDSPIEEALQTLIHESVHAAIHISGLSQMLPQYEQDGMPDIEEAITVMFENAFGHVIDIQKLKLDI